MFKKLQLLFAFLLLAGTASAQGLKIGGPLRLPEIPAAQRTPLMRFEQLPRFAPRRQALPVDPDLQMWWGYNGNADPANYYGVGTSVTETYWVAIQVPESESLTQGKTIKALRIALTGAPCMKDLHLWISEQNLPNSIDDCVVDVPVTNILDREFNEVELPTPYTIPNKTIYIGYNVTVTENSSDSNYPILFSNGDESMWIRTSQTVTSWSEQTSFGPPFIQALLEGDFPHNALAVNKSFLDIFALPDGTAEAEVTLISKGLGTISSIDYTVGDANADSDEQHLDIEPFGGMNAQSVVRIPVKADAQTGRTPRYITITKVNGVENAIEGATAEGYMVTLSKAVERRTVVEEFTGTWCGWCPRGITGMQKVNEQFGDKAITIIVHGSDPMAIEYGASASSYPMAYVDRGVAADPFFGISDDELGILDLVADRNKILAEASVSLQQPTLSKSGTISFKTNVTFNYDNRKAPYAMGYVLLADGLKGSGKDWAQANYYNTESAKESFGDCPSLQPWFDADGYIPMTYDHVAVAAKGMDAQGGGISAPIVNGKQLTLNGSLGISGNTVLQGFENLKVVAVLFNTDNGYIVNADIQPVVISEDFSQNRMQVKAFEQVGAVKGGTADVQVPVANFGSNGVKSIDYRVHYSGRTVDQHIDLPNPITSYGVYTNVSFPVPASPESGIAKDTIEILKVNGADNEATAGKSATGSILTVAKASKRRTVVEEFTGTWCMWCPRGTAGLKRLHAEYPDDVVLMAIHNGGSSGSDPMQVTTFNKLAKTVSGFPSAYLNRYLSCDPMYGTGEDEWGIINDIEAENSQMVEAAVELHQPEMDQNTGEIKFTTDVTFQINRKSAPYLLSYVLVGDGLKGTGDEWLQFNAYAAYYSGEYADDPYMNEICNVWDIYAEVEYNHVALAGLGVDAGVTNSLKNVVEEGQVQSHSAKFATKSNKLAQMAKNLRVIAMLYDKNAKRFINADEKEVVVVDAVTDLSSTTSTRVAACYSLDGKALAAPTRGINIVRMADGTVRKVLVK
jgi:thiol-disulfide isomerase/thioredoxin